MGWMELVNNALYLIGFVVFQCTKYHWTMTFSNCWSDLTWLTWVHYPWEIHNRLNSKPKKLTEIFGNMETIVLLNNAWNAFVRKTFTNCYTFGKRLNCPCILAFQFILLSSPLKLYIYSYLFCRGCLTSHLQMHWWLHMTYVLHWQERKCNNLGLSIIL
jgi:hypothetical protein